MEATTMRVVISLLLATVLTVSSGVSAQLRSHADSDSWRALENNGHFRRRFLDSSSPFSENSRQRPKLLGLLNFVGSNQPSPTALVLQDRRESLLSKKIPRTNSKKSQRFAEKSNKTQQRLLLEQSQWMEKKRQLQQQQQKNETVETCHNSTNCDDALSLAMDKCQDDALFLEANPEKKYQCSCSKNSMNGVTMNCQSQCGHYCNTDATIRTRAGDVCGREELDHVYDENGNAITRADHFVYTKGINNRLSIVEHDCSLSGNGTLKNLTCNSCSVKVGTTQTCGTCEMILCPDGNRAPLVDCTNLGSDTVLNLCDRKSIPAQDGVFSSLSLADFEQCTDESPENDQCNDTSELTVPDGSSILGLTDQAMVDGIESCTGSSTSPGLWYRVEGSGTGIAVSTCGSITNFDTQISIYSGKCDTLQCVAHNDDKQGEECGFGQSAVSFFGEKGVVYHIKVTGFGTATGLFELEFREIDLAVDECLAMKTRTASLSPFEEGMECKCQSTEDGSQSLDCADTCQYCSSDGATCATKTSSGIFDQKSTAYNKTKTITYTKGRNQTIQINELDCVGEGCGRCDVVVDGIQCNSCSFQTCDDQSVNDGTLSINCTNVDPKAIFDGCEAPMAFEDGVFQALAHDSFQECLQDPLEACQILAEQKMELSANQRTHCSCDKSSAESATLLCYDDNCRFCNYEEEICANITYGGTVTSQSQGLAVEYREYEYVTGRSEVLRLEEDESGCSFFIDGRLCSSCMRVPCQDELEEFQGIIVNCTNIEAEAVFNECSPGQNPKGIFEVFSTDEFEQCIEGEDPMETCLRLKKEEENQGFERNTTCECHTNSISGEHTLTCWDSGCQYCNHLATVCATNVYGYQIGSFGEPLLYFDGYHHINEHGSKTDHVVVEYKNDECIVRVNDQECNSCELELCANEGQGRMFHDIRVDCENVQSGASFDSCTTGSVDTGILVVASDDNFGKCIIPTSPQQACLSEAALQEGQTHGVECSCTSNDQGGADLFCVETGCLYCDSDRQSCGYDTSRAVFNRLGYLIESGLGFRFISGVNGDLLFQPVRDPGDPRDCYVSFKDELCNSCEIHECSPGIQGLKIDCQNLEGGSYIDQCKFEEVSGFLEYLSPQSFLQCMNTKDPMAFCEEQKDFTKRTNIEDRGTVCTCHTESEETKLTCTDQRCVYCNADASVCKTNALYGGTISKFGFFTSNMDVSQYVQGRNERVAIEQTPGGSCKVTIDERQCSSCNPVVCDDESIDLDIDCTNVMEGATHYACINDFENGVFALLSDASFEICLANDGSNEKPVLGVFDSSSKGNDSVKSQMALVWLLVMLASLM
jgi:hypothetical protein